MRIDNCCDSLPLTYFYSSVELVAEPPTGKELEDSQHLVNIHSTSIQHPSNVELVENAQTPDEEINSETQEFIQHITKDEGREGVLNKFNLMMYYKPSKSLILLPLKKTLLAKLILLT